jgi:thiamine-phosphate pyrophosphorylase
MMPLPRWPDRPLMLVTDRHRCAGDLVETVEAALEGGVNLVQLREKDLPAGDLFRLARRLRGVTAGRALLLINDRIDVALLCGADGVHLGERGLPVAAVRSWLPAGMLLGRSAHTVPGARRAELDGADYLLLGTLFPSRSHPDAAPAGLALLEQVVARVSLPVLGIGGVGPAEASACRERGAAGVAVIDGILDSRDPRRAAAALREALERSRE